jgi:hypothetical protein
MHIILRVGGECMRVYVVCVCVYVLQQSGEDKAETLTLASLAMLRPSDSGAGRGGGATLDSADIELNSNAVSPLGGLALRSRLLTF